MITKRARYLLVAIGVILFPFILFALNGLVFSDRNQARTGSVTTFFNLAPTSSTVRVMSYNIAKAFIYQGRGQLDSKEHVDKHLNEISVVIRNANPDIVCLSEVIREGGWNHTDQVEYLAEHTGLTNWAFGECYSFGLPFYRMVGGNAVLSRYPLTALGNLDLPGRQPFYITRNNRRALVVEVSLPRGTLPLWSLHNDSFDITNNLAQTEYILEHPLSQHAMLAGDFNAEPHTKPVELLQSSLRFQGAFDSLPTYPSSNPTRAIDFVFAPSTWTMTTHTVLTNTVSDHHPVLTDWK